MGWLFMRGLQGYGSPRSYLDNQFTYANEHGRSTVLASAMGRGTVYYAAIEYIPVEGASSVFAVICLVKFNPRAADGFNFGYKDMSESMGPYEADCPAAILDLLSQTDNEHALAWREKCRAAIAARAQISARPTPKPGQTIIFNPPLELTNGQVIARFTVIDAPKRGVRFRDPKSGVVVRVPNVKRRGYSLINAAVTA
ncbi:MAG: hypothetical protein ABIQ66_10725 [Novosphingobium sp.]